MAGICKDLLDRAGLDDAAAIHDRYAVGDFGDDAEVVRDQDHRRAVSAWRRASIAKTCACTVTSSAVVGSSARISFGLPGQRHGDHRALPHAARELVRILLGPASRVGDVDLAQQLDCAPVRGLPQAAVRDLSLGDLPPDRQDRIERGGRVLEDEPDLLPPQSGERSARRRSPRFRREQSSRGPARLQAAGR